MPNLDVGVRIRELRKSKKLSREALAEKIDISPKFLYEIETGKKGFSAETLCKISKELSVSCDYIMLGEEAKLGNMGKMARGLEKIEPKQARQVQDILNILYDMCGVIN